MKVLVLSNLYPPYFRGGYELKCRLHVDELRRRGHQISILASRWGVEKGDGSAEGDVFRSLEYDPLSMGLDLEDTRLGPVRIARRYLQARWALTARGNYHRARNLMARLAPDVVYVWNMAGVSVYPILAAQDAGIPTVLRVDDYWLADIGAHLWEVRNPVKRSYRETVGGHGGLGRLEVGRMLVVSNWVKQRYMEIGFPVGEAVVLPEGVPRSIILDPSELPLAQQGFASPRLLFVGRVDPLKGTHVAIEAMDTLVRRLGVAGASLDIVGSGPGEYLAQLKEQVASLGLRDRVSFLGFVPHHEVLRRFGEYTAVLIPSMWEEPLAGTIAEAMARGLPVIATDQGGNPEIIRDGENGLLVPAGDAGATAGAAKRLVDDPHLWERLRSNGLETVRRDYVHERIVDRAEEYLFSAVPGTVGGASALASRGASTAWE